MSIPVLLPTLAARFAAIIGIMFFDRPRGLGNDLPFHPLLNLVHLRLRDRFAAILARAEAGTLRASPRRRAGKPMAPRLTWPRPPRVLPSGYMWMAKLAPWTSNLPALVQLAQGRPHAASPIARQAPVRGQAAVA